MMEVFGLGLILIVIVIEIGIVGIVLESGNMEMRRRIAELDEKIKKIIKNQRS